MPPVTPITDPASTSPVSTDPVAVSHRAPGTRRRVVLGAGLLWLALVGMSLASAWQRVGDSAVDMAKQEARYAFEKDVVYRRWAAMQGGLYVVASTHTPPNPYLADHPERDLTTAAGKTLTLVNPAYMTRQVHELSKATAGVRGHITSLRPIRPENVADAWEASALRAFEKGQVEASSIETLDGQSFLRYMRPLVTEKSCLSCHGPLGAHEGDIRGGISVSVPFAPYAASADAGRWRILAMHLALAVLGVAGTWEANRRLRASERLLRASEQQHRALVSGMPDIVAKFDPSGRHLFVSARFEELFGLRACDVVGRTPRELGAPLAVCAQWEAAFARAVESGEPHEAEIVVPTPSGERVLNARLVPERDRKGRVRSVLNISRDITEHRAAERRYEALFQSMREGFVLVEAVDGGDQRTVDYRVLAVNPAFERLTGLAADRVVGHTVRAVLPGLEERWFDVLGRVAATGEPVHMEDYASAFEMYFEVTAFSPARGQCACTFADVSDRRRSEVERDRLREQLAHAHKLESVGRLAGGVAHDFNNMLGVILGHAELALHQFGPAHPVHEGLREIHDTALRSVDLTRQLLAFARRQPASPRLLNPNTCIESALSMLRRLIGEQIDLQWLPGAEVWPVCIDPSQLDQVLTNLCVNARDAIGGNGRITIRTRNAVREGECGGRIDRLPEGDYVVVSVSDTGGGIDPAVLPHLFEPFFTTKAVGRGTGLGLATVYGIVKQNRGAIDVMSRPGEGTTFELAFPRADREEASAPVAQPVAGGGTETILLVEDDAALLRLGAALLGRLGYRVLTADRAAEAERLAEAHAGQIDLLMTDIVMPDMNGRDLATRLLARFPTMRCLFTSGYTADVIAHHGVLEAGVHLLEKPFSLAKLAAKVREVMGPAGAENAA